MIVITGASRGIGSYLREEFLKAGDPVCGTYNSTPPVSNEDGSLSKVDISNFSDVDEWINKIKYGLDRITLVNCAGINYNCLAHKANLDDWRKVIDVNLVGTFNVTRKILPIMRDKGFGRIINFSSVVAQTPVAGASAYAASKAGLWGLTKSIATENAKKGITINNLNLGYFDIGMIDQVPLAYLEKIREKIPTGKLCNPKEIYKTIRFLMESNEINGTSIDINSALF